MKGIQVTWQVYTGKKKLLRFILYHEQGDFSSIKSGPMLENYDH